MEYSFRKKDGILIAQISGELDHHNAAPLRAATDSEIKAGGVRGLILDFSGLEMMDSSGIGVIMGRLKLMESLGGHVCVAGAKAPIRKIIALSGLGKLVGLCDNVSRGIGMLKSSAN